LIAILDYGSGNLRSAQRACEETGQRVVVTSDYETALSADGLVVPGVGAFGACMDGLLKVKGDLIIRQRVDERKKVFGICVGMQILFRASAETFAGEEPEGLGIFPGKVTKLSAPITPHIGWNTLSVPSESTIFKGIENERFYFVHSYAASKKVPSAVNIEAEYGSTFLAAIESDIVTAVQFHPEKSGSAGLQLIKNWTESL
jgi:glutamine amidotransferase